MNALETVIDDVSKTLPIYECNLLQNTGRYGLYSKGHILIEQRMNDKSKKVVIMEEYLHSKHTIGNILDESDIRNKKQENFVRRKNYELLFSWKSIVTAFNMGFTYYHDVAEYFDLPEDFIREAVEHYKSTHELLWDVGEYVIFLGNYMEVYKK